MTELAAAPLESGARGREPVDEDGVVGVDEDADPAAVALQAPDGVTAIDVRLTADPD